MKKNFCGFLAFSLLLGLSLTGCSSDDDAPVVGPSEPVVYSPERIDLTLNGGSPMVGKSVAYTPQGNGRGVITLAGSPINLSQIMSRADDVEPFTFPTPGVLPGSTSVDIPVTLASDGSFSGDGATDYCTFKYSGKLTDTDVRFALTDVTLKNTTLSNTTWKVTPLAINENGERVSDPFHIIWEESAGIDMGFGSPMPAQTILQLMMVMPLIEIEGQENKVSINDLMPLLLRSVKFGADGTIGGTYADMEADTPAPVEIPAGIASYVVESESSMRLFLNPYAIMASQSRGREFNINEALAQLMNMGGTMIAGGVPVAIKIDGDQMSAYLTTETLLPLLKIAAEACADPAIIEMINQAIESGEIAMDGMEAMLPVIVAQIPAVVNSTTRIEIGMNLTRQ